MEKQRLYDADALESKMLFEASAMAGTIHGPGYGKALKTVKEFPTVAGGLRCPHCGEQIDEEVQHETD